MREIEGLTLFLSATLDVSGFIRALQSTSPPSGRQNRRICKDEDGS